MAHIVNQLEAYPSQSAVLRKVGVRLIPFLFVLYVINLIDRTNIGIARLQMVDQQPQILSEEAYSLGAGIFYVGYLLFEVPSNLILLRVGARLWIARILVIWGLVSASMMFVTGPWSFAILRVLLGFAEAGFFPGMILYLSRWFPARARAHAVATFMTGGVIASMVGNPISGVILEYMDQIAGLSGWQWVFLLEGLPAVVLGFITLQFLTDRPDQATWLNPAERAWLAQELAHEHGPGSQYRSHTLWAAFSDRRVWLLIAVYFTVAVGDNSYGFYIPTFLKSRFSDWTPSQIGFLAAAPGVVAILGMNLVGRHSDKTGERRWHVAGSAFLAVFGWLMIALAPSPWLFVLGLALTLTGMKSMLPTFWTLPPSFLSGTAAAGGIALINSVANLGGMLGPNIIGQGKSITGSFTAGFLVMAGTLLMGGFLVLCVRPDSRPSTWTRGMH
jgi:ACS family tartrate transporter-like MFS transporter